MSKQRIHYKPSGLNHVRSILVLFVLALHFPAIGQQKITPSFDYQQINGHPRLLLNRGEEKTIKGAIARNSEFQQIDAYIREVSDGLLRKEPVTFQKKGKRLLAVSREALTRLYYLSYSYRMTGDTKYLQRAEKELHAVCDFESWNPSHFLDVGEMCMAVAIAYDWLYADLQEQTKMKVRKAIVEKAIAPSYEKKYNRFLNMHNNWNSVCNAGLVYGALAIFEDDKEQAIAVIERALKSTQLPLQAYAPDGNYPEGPSYWNYGTTFQVMLSAALESALGSDNGLSDSPGFMESAYYMLFTTGPSGYYFNYSDCGRQIEPSPSMFWFANKLNDPTLIFQEKALINKGVYTRLKGDRTLPNMLIFGKDLTLSKIKTPSKKMYTGHGITPVTIVRATWEAGGGKYLGIKGGSASAPHAHMDQGTFVYDIGHLRWAMDFGLQSYITLESKGVDLWNKEQASQRWEVFRHSNLNHNTLTINNQRHHVNGQAEIIETFDSKKESGAKIDLMPVLNLNNELKAATRKAVIVDESYLNIEDIVEANANPVALRWNMVTPATAEIVDDHTIRLSQQGQAMILKFEGNVPFELAIRPSENPKDYINEFTGNKYGDYNLPNKGTVMVGFDANIPAGATARFEVTFVEDKVETLLPKNTFVLDAPNPSMASEGNTVFSDVSPIGINASGELYPMEIPDWIPYGKVNKDKLFGTSFGFKIHAQRITPNGLEDAGIDRSNDGLLGIRGGGGNGIDVNEGFVLGLDLRKVDPSMSVELTKIGLLFFDASESCTIVNRQNGKMTVLKGSDRKKLQEVEITDKHKRRLRDISELGIVLKGGENHTEFLSLFNTTEGSWRIAGFEFVVK
ncbi:DUF4962 domain-containing protein [Sphingobacterium sp. SGG-5]|uniref:heparinase II/III domain-containing protein n=1 Tax=Sphingobacterium sp. SGG-5 TaxID=2710881 RepID=UPI0013EDF9C6|nr:heparinase II/III family protein [Sphingobacterium sp. SGG-5]NGM61047.1 DUF4962 domain-containing protein [Sphingobacterium sp. SGG-5]